MFVNDFVVIELDDRFQEEALAKIKVFFKKVVHVHVDILVVEC